MFGTSVSDLRDYIKSSGLRNNVARKPKRHEWLIRVQCTCQLDSLNLSLLLSLYIKGQVVAYESRYLVGPVERTYVHYRARRTCTAWMGAIKITVRYRLDTKLTSMSVLESCMNRRTWEGGSCEHDTRIDLGGMIALRNTGVSVKMSRKRMTAHQIGVTLASVPRRDRMWCPVNDTS